MAGTDSIVIPVELGNLDVEKFLQQLGPKLKQRIAEVARGMVGGQVPQIPTTVVAKERMEIRGKTYESTTRARLSAIQQSIGEGGEEDILSLEKIAIAIREVRKQLTQEEKTRLKNIKDLGLSAKKAKEEFIDSLVKLDTTTIEKQFKEEANQLRQEKKQQFKELATGAKAAKKEFIDSLVQLDTTNIEKQFKDEANQLRREKKQQFKDLATGAKAAKKEFVDSLVQLDTTSLRQRMSKDFRSKISIQPPEENIRAVQQAIRDGLISIQEGNALIAKESKKFVDSVKSARRQRFGEFAKRLQTIDPNIAIRELDQYINQRTATFVNEAKILRDRLQKQIQSARQQAQQTRNRNFANNALVGAGIGLGALGSAGFPLLNVGFAAMSGGPVGASIVALSTAIGEATRAFSRFSESTKNAAREIGLVSSGFKIAEARQKVFDAFIGQGAMSIKRAATELNLRDFKSSGGGLREFNKLFENLKETAKTTGANVVTGTKTPNFLDLILGAGTPIPFLDRIAKERFAENKKLAESFELSDLLSARRNFISQMNRSTVGMESPYETWKRIQTAAFDPAKQEEMKTFQAMLKDLDELVKIAEDNHAARKAASSRDAPWTSPFWGVGF